MESPDIALFILALIAITGTLISLFEHRTIKPGKPQMKSKATKLQQRP
ncbi:hypothetical protein NP554_23645 [Pseudomonas asiatica]|uniref:Uncharacterized protein n=1 Tax=Pseudomonas asiatica TaxID=2219225 RepID=A0A9X4DDX2_9PSED|nr:MULTISPECIES: hypothetical protein [Pseudomonas]MEE1902654.1 hypothetical protein [Pseudomonas inefficax]AHD17293.1 hypothetical protein C163_19925 [Pseudomonas sp. FGI182]MDD2114783.1 hypothetical protein [Pseudomonas asiatica]MEE1907447.1 hypothetical protein [Pseudomonas inefficax]MEE1984911.1 hypothetical protein [Pseudomonas inefficax]